MTAVTWTGFTIIAGTSAGQLVAHTLTPEGTWEKRTASDHKDGITAVFTAGDHAYSAGRDG